ncbi:MAG: hypothetical protein JRI97_09630 [Deltaproteobacteria bacterium]|nr:hypothetical protein [Deltaproteobacteria bacterium]
MHDPGHKHSHGHEHQPAAVTTSEKLEKLLEHWIKHNEDHAETFRTWKERADEEGLSQVAEVLKEAADANLALNRKMAAALESLRKKG